MNLDQFYNKYKEFIPKELLKAFYSDLMKLKNTYQEQGDNRRSPFTEEQKEAFAKAIFDNDYSAMNRLKEQGRWLIKK